MTFSQLPSPVVVDASVAVGAAVGSEVDADAMRSWIEVRRMVLVPAHFWPESANALLLRRRLPVDAVRLRIAGLIGLGIESVRLTGRRLDEAIVLADRRRLSVYDALYLQVAAETGGGLATHDQALARAAKAEGVELEPLG